MVRANAVRNRWPPIKILVVSGAVKLQASELPANSSFVEKPVMDGWMNAGFFVLNTKVFDYLSGDDCIFERDPLERLTE